MFRIQNSIIKKINDPNPSIFPKDFQNLQEQIKEAADKLIDFSDESNIGKCDDVCKPKCTITRTYDCDCDANENCKTCCDCRCECEGIYNRKPYPQEINENYNLIKNYQAKIQSAYSTIQSAIDDIYESFYKLNSEYPAGHPEEGEKVAIGTDYVCTDEFGNCRDDDWKIDWNDKVEEKEYTLKEKLVTVQKLLNMSRETIDPQGTTSVYELLLEELVDLDLIHRRELSYFRKMDAIEKMDLQNCQIFYETLEETEEEEPLKEIFNCRNAEAVKIIDHFDMEMCSPDPYLDANFFHATSSRERTPTSCYCYDEDADRDFRNLTKFPELYYMGSFIGFGNNYFCCVKEYEN